MNYIKKEYPIIQNKATRAYKNFLDVILMLFTVIAIALVSFSYFYVDVQVLGPSMQPTINAEWENTDEDRHKQDTAYIKTNGDIKRGDIIVVQLDELFIIKRLIAKGGDRVNILQESETDEINVYLNGEALQENYVVYESGLVVTLSNFNELRDDKPELFDDGELVVPENYVFYLGDNRGQSQDSSSYGPKPREQVIGSVDIIVPYDQTFIEYMLNEFIDLF